jgi:hypothetical protein
MINPTIDHIIYTYIGVVCVVTALTVALVALAIASVHLSRLLAEKLLRSVQLSFIMFWVRRIKDRGLLRTHYEAQALCLGSKATMDEYEELEHRLISHALAFRLGITQDLVDRLDNVVQASKGKTVNATDIQALVAQLQTVKDNISQLRPLKDA